MNIAMKRAIYFPTIGTPQNFMLAKHEFFILLASFIVTKVNNNLKGRSLSKITEKLLIRKKELHK